ncbi:MAG: hypothetical protein ACT4OJ_13085 [Bacteroidota bacterium]
MDIPAHFQSLQQDAILWKAQYVYSRAKGPDERAAAIEALAAMVLALPGATRQATYVQEIEATVKLKKNMLAKAIEAAQKQRGLQQKRRQQTIGMEENEEGGIPAEEESKLPTWISRDDEDHWRRHGYFPCNKQVNDRKKVGYYSISTRQTEAGPIYNTNEITNFIMTPVMHVYKGDESRHIVEICNGFVTAVKEVQSKIIPSREQFQAAAVTEGSFAIFGSNLQWLRIASDMLHKFPRCIELEDLGYHPAGFFAYSDHIYVPGTGRVEVDKYGIFEAPTGKTGKYLLPQQSEAYMALQGTGSDPFENDRVLTWKQSPVTFQRWCEMVHRVFNMQGTVGIAFCIFTLFRDIVAKVTGTSPHLYLFGPPQSGKSVLAEMIYSLFYVNRNFFIAYEGTVPAFYTYLTRFINCPAVINEVDANTTDPDRLQAFKGAFDLEGREKMNIAQKANKRSTTIQRINSSLILVGQHIVTNDDNALLTRSIIEDFLPNDNRTREDINAFDELKQLGKSGITSLLTELLSMRPYFEANFRQQYLEQVGEWMNETSRKGKPLTQRIMQNYAIVSTCYKMLCQHYTALPVPAGKFKNYCLQKATQWSQFVSSSDTLSEFWRYLAFLYESGQVLDGWDIVVETCTELETREGVRHQWDAGELVLYIRLNNVHKVYQAEHRKRTAKDGISMENLLHYFKSKKYFIGPIKSKRFKRFQQDYIEQKLSVLTDQVCVRKDLQQQEANLS